MNQSLQIEKKINNLEMSLEIKSLIGRNFIIIFSFIVVVTIYVSSLSLKDTDVKELIEMIVYGYFSVSILRFTYFLAGEILDKKKSKVLDQNFSPLVSILLPAFNEEKMISEVLENLKNLNYKNFEVLVIDDGSTDKTFTVAKNKALTLPFKVRVITKLNGGKASALNLGIEESRGDYLLCMDADTTLSAGTLTHSLQEFSENKRLGALAGMVKIAETNSLLSCLQNLEYLIGYFQRKTLSYFGKVTIIPGPIGLFRKRAIKSVGGYEKENTTFAEDAELTLRLLAAGWEIKSCSDMISYTEGPQSLEQLIRQRYRWSRGLYQALFKNIKRLIYSYNDANILVLLYLLWEQIVLPIFDFSILISLVYFFIFGVHFEALTFVYLGIIGMDILVSILACRKEKNIIFWSFISIISRFTYANLLLVWKLCALCDEWKQLAMSWDKIERRGSIRVEKSELAV